MVQWLKRLLYESTPAEFRSAYGVAESVERLLAATKRSAFSAIGETAAVGKVSSESVRLQRVIPMIHNSFKPFFTGRFETRNGVTVLTGSFGMATFTKIFMSVWLGLVAVFAGTTFLASLHSTVSSPTGLVFGPLLMLAAGLGFVALGKWFARNDAAWLSGVIAQALNAPSAGTVSATREVDSAAVPGVLKVVALVLAASAAMVVFMDFLAPQMLHAPLVDSPSVPLRPRQWHGVFAVLSLMLAAGIWRRRPWAWWGGFVLLGLSIILSLLDFPADIQRATPLFVRVIFGVFASIVVGIWGRWWYAQRRHFLWVEASAG